MKFNKIATLLLACGLLSSTATLFAGKANAAQTDNSTATFNATVPKACKVKTAYSTVSYPTTNVAVSTGVVSLTANQTADFDCNTDTVAITAVVTFTPPTAAANATELNAVVNTTIDNTAPLSANTATFAGPGTIPGTGSWKTDTKGNLGVKVTSTITAGEELLAGLYTSTVMVTVSAN